jgi:hypothetical protein
MQYGITIYRGTHAVIDNVRNDSLSAALDRLVRIGPWDDDRTTGWSVDEVQDPRVTFELLDALSDYLGGELVPAQLVDLADDPDFRNTWAIRLRWPDGTVRASFLFYGVLYFVLSSELEECDFGSWPPKVR